MQRIRKVVLKDGFLQRIGSTAFSGCSSLSRIEIPPSITSIDDFAFNGCTALVRVVLHEGLNKIGDRAFLKCSSLLHVDIPHSVIDVCNTAFNGCAVTFPRDLNGRIIRPYCLEG